MTTNDHDDSTQRGYAWRGDSTRRLATLLAGRGHAKARGPAAAESCARDLLIRYIHQDMTRGWDPADLEVDDHAHRGWPSELDRITSVSPVGLWEAPVENAPPGWLPTDSEDPDLVAFDKHWPREKDPTP
jgi:hypothetical protein